MVKNLKLNIESFLKEDGVEATPENVVERLMTDFPEVVLLLAEENYLRGYAQGITDIRNMENEQSDNQ